MNGDYVVVAVLAGASVVGAIIWLVSAVQRWRWERQRDLNAAWSRPDHDGMKCESRRCPYPALAVCLRRDPRTGIQELTGRCEGCANEGEAMGWWKRVPGLTPAQMVQGGDR